MENEMEVNDQTTWSERLTPGALNRLALNNERLIDGSDKIVVNPAYEKISDGEIIGMVEDILSKITLTPKLRQIEDSNRDKIGPRSIAKPWVERKPSLLDYFDHGMYDPGELYVAEVGDLKRFIPASPGSAISNLIGSSSAGLPYLMRKSKVLSRLEEDWSKDRGVYPCVLYTRTQENRKTRNVWGYPVSDTIWEQMYYMPILNAEKSLLHRAALLGPDAVDAAISRLLMGKSDSELIYCVDFSSFDASIHPRYSYQAFCWMASCFQSNCRSDLYELYKRFVTIGIFTPDGEIKGPHGVPSGSSFTNLIDSFVQLKSSGMDGNKCQIQGDDGVYVIKKSDREDLIRNFESAGLKINEDKSEEFDTQEAVYLQRYYHPDYKSKLGGLGGVYSLMRAMHRIKYLEKWTDFKKMEIDGSDFFSMRTISILENCKHHPLFEELVRLAHRLDRNNLAVSKSGIAAYSRAQTAKVRAGVLQQYGQEGGIDNFETVKLLKTL